MKSILKQFSAYTLTTFLVAGIPFLLMPVLTNYLTPGDYGIMALLTSLTRVLMPFIGIGVANFSNVTFFQKDKIEFKKIFSSLLAIPFVGLICLAILFYLLSPVLASYVGLPNKEWILVVPFLAFFLTIEELVLGLFRNQNRPVLYGIIKVVRSVAEISLTLFLVIAIGLNWEGRISSWLITSLLLFLVFLYFIISRGYLKIQNINKPIVFSILSFGIPLIPEQMAVYAISLSDKFFLAKMVTIDEVGLYSVGAQVGLILGILTSALLQGFIPYLYSNLKSKDPSSKLSIVKINYLFMSIIFAGFVGLNLITPFIFDWFHKSFEGAQEFVFWISFGFVFEAFYILMNHILIFNKKTKLVASISSIALIVNLVLNFVLIYFNGAVGAAYATLITYFFMALTTFIFANRYFPLPWLRTWKNA